MFNFGDLTFDIQCTAIIISSCLGGYILYKLLSRNSKVDDITNKCIFITGCDSGFGRALALQLDKQNVPVFAGCLTIDGAKSLSEKASSLLNTLELDVCSSDSIKNAFRFVSDNMSPGMTCWGVVNNAGITGPPGPTEFLSRSDFEKVMQVNFFGQVDVINTFMPLLKKSKGRIVNIASIAAKFPVGPCGYIASKFAVFGYTESLRLEKQPWGISVSTILPGSFGTGITENIIQSNKECWSNLPEEIKEEYGDQYHEDYINILSCIKQSLVTKSDLSPVTNAIADALFSTKPNALYFPGLDAKFLSYIERLPFGLNQYLYEKLHKLHFAKAVPKVLKNK